MSPGHRDPAPDRVPPVALDDWAAERYSVLDRYARFNAQRRPGRWSGLWYGLRRIGATVAGWIARIVASRPTAQGPCDVLLLHGWDGSRGRLAPVTVELERRGCTVRHHRRLGRLARFRARALSVQPGVPAAWRVDTFYARYLLDRYSPRVVVLVENYSPLVTCLRVACRGRAILVNLAHSVMPPGDGANMFDVDYYFVFGQSSVDIARRKPVRVGTTALVQSGSFDIKSGAPPQAGSARTVLFFSALSAPFLQSPLVPEEPKRLIMANTRMVLACARRMPGYQWLLKPHPLEVPGLLAAMAEDIPNVRILEPGVSVPAAVAQASLGIVMWSNAALETAVLGRPVLVANLEDFGADYLEIERYFLPRAASSEQLEVRILEALDGYPALQASCAAFVRRHLARTGDAPAYIAQCLEVLARGSGDVASEPLAERLEGLTGRHPC